MHRTATQHTVFSCLHKLVTCLVCTRPTHEILIFLDFQATARNITVENHRFFQIYSARANGLWPSARQKIGDESSIFETIS
jgi:hypothetical protein